MRHLKTFPSIPFVFDQNKFSRINHILMNYRLLCLTTVFPILWWMHQWNKEPIDQQRTPFYNTENEALTTPGEDCENRTPLALEPYELSASATKTTYQTGETVNFLVRSNRNGKVKYTISEDKHTLPIIEGELELTANTVATITASFDKPGFLLLQVEQNENRATAGVGISPCEIRATTEKPADFEQFWSRQLAQLNTVPFEPKITKRMDKSSERQTTYKIVLNNIDGKKVYGWVSIPNCEGPFSAVFSIPSYGRAPIGPLTYMADDGVIAVTMSIHNYDCEQEVPKAIAYQPENHYFDRHTNYYRAAILGGIRMIDYIFTLPEFDGEHLGITGVSQGGGLALMLSGLDDRIKFLAQAQATFCDHTGILDNRSSGFPYWIVNADLKGGDPVQLAEEVAYYDAVNFVDNFKGISFHSIGYTDDVCPPATVFAAYNRIKGEKYMLHGIENSHDLPAEFWNLRQLFWESNMPIQSAPDCEMSVPSVATGAEHLPYYNEIKVLPLLESNDFEIQIDLSERSDIMVVLSSITGQVLSTEKFPGHLGGRVNFNFSNPYSNLQVGILQVYAGRRLLVAEKVVLE